MLCASVRRPLTPRDFFFAIQTLIYLDLAVNIHHAGKSKKEETDLNLSLQYNVVQLWNCPYRDLFQAFSRLLFVLLKTFHELATTEKR